VSLREVEILYLRELRSALRERSVVVFSVLVPIFLYPLLLWLVFTGIGLVMGTNESFVSRLALLPVGSQGGLFQQLGAGDDVEIEPDVVEAGVALDRIRDGRLDALLERLPPEGQIASREGSFSVRLTFDGAKDRSTIAERRVRNRLDRYRNQWLHRRARRLGISEAEWRQVEIETRDEASKRQLGAFLMGLMLPILMIAMVAMGCFYPAIETTAGERERGTWETLFTTGASRGAIVTAKYLHVATLGTAAGLLNLTAMTLSMGPVLKGLLGSRAELAEFSFPIRAVPVMILGTLVLALFVAAGMMVFAVFARTFKEGQSLITPFYLVVLLPALFTQAPDLRLSFGLALFPIANLAMVFRESLAGQLHLPLVALTLLVEAASVALLLWLALAVLRFEDVVVGSYQGGPMRLFRERLLGRSRRRT
jgi:sodium transport system permease protein